ncbi:replication endonuclease [Pectobacterium versatile]|uniref:replication endonuclease n=1 Tax=Pectobacterium versatile TaxID=2488639 RepID=UPI00102E469E|nr:replication endonuclease [Pectobacterium versatile]TAI92992.1 replication endonuclease [Pectobacterium versatile]UEQ07688.1 replication endonuclease [Pectobacterium versatile]
MPEQWAYPWNAPRPAISIPLGIADSFLPSATNTTTPHPAVDNHLKRLVSRSTFSDLDFDQAVARLDYFEPNSTLLKMRRQFAEAERDEHQATLKNWMETPEGVESRLLEQPFFIRDTYRQKIEWLRANREVRHVSAFFMGTVKKALLRLDAVRVKQGVRDGFTSELASYWRARWQHLAEFTKHEAINAGHAIAASITEMFETECGNTLPADMTNEEIQALFWHLGREMLALRITPPCWGVIIGDNESKKRICSAILRIISPEWWGRKLWRLRCEWRENQFRAIGVIHKKRMPYVSLDALNQWQEQRRKNREFFKAHELVDEDGNVASLENMVYASISNPVIRRHELMTRMAGVEMIAISRSDEGVFLTITCPSRYHATIQNGHQNPKWDTSSPRQGQRYLCKTWAKAMSKLNRRGLRPYGFRVAEPHHDATPHWHVLLFMPPEDRKEIVSILREYFIAEDRSELGRNTGARFKAKRLDPKKGSATAYVAKYISKNIDGYALDGERDNETGKPLRETAKFAMAWASQHNIRQFQPFGLPPVTVWRELRKLANQLTAVQKEAGTFKRGASQLADPAMDAVLASADAGCFATYIEKQGGVLIPRELYTVRIAYEEADEQNDYGETPEKIFGVFSPRLGELSRICTRLVKWKIRKKQAADAGANDSAGRGLAVTTSPTGDAWSSVNNSTGDEKISISEPADREIGSTSEPETIDFEHMTDTERRGLLNRIRSQPPDRRHSEHSSTTQTHETTEKQTVSKRSDDWRASVADFARSLGWDISAGEVRRLETGSAITLAGYAYVANGDGCLYRAPTSQQKDKEYQDRAAALLHRIATLSTKLLR